MIEVTGDIWDFHSRGFSICITTNSTIKKDGSCVMGRGVAAQAKRRFPKLPRMLGKAIQENGHQVHWFPELRIFAFPVKYSFWDMADLELITESCKQLIKATERKAMRYPIYLVRPGCGNGQLDWATVKPVIEKLLDDRFIVAQI